MVRLGRLVLYRLRKSTGLNRWLKKGVWAILDQGLWGASNLVIHILMARWTAEDSFGAFAVAFAAHILMLTFYNALIVEPMLVFGGGRFRGRFSEYLSFLLHANWALTLPATLGALAIGLFLSWSESNLLGSAFLGLAVATPFLFFSWLLRQSCYVRQQPRLAALGGGLYVALILIGMAALHRAGWLTAFSAFCLMGGTRLVSGLTLAALLPLQWRPPRLDRLARVVLRRHWDYGRWAAAACVPMRFPGQVILLVLPIWGGLAATGALKALANLVMPITQANAALGVLLVPTLARMHGQPRFFRLTRVMFALFFATAVACWLLLGFFGQPLVDWMYGGRYLEYAGLLWIMGLGPVLAAGKEVLGSALRASEHPKWIFWSHTTSAVIALPCSLLLIALYGLLGAVLGTLLLSLVTVVAMLFFYLKLQVQQARERSRTPEPEIADEPPEPHERPCLESSLSPDGAAAAAPCSTEYSDSSPASFPVAR